MDPYQPPLPQEEPMRVNVPPLPPTEPLSHPRPSKRLGIGDADGSKLITGPPTKKSRKIKESNGLGSKPPITAAELQALEDGELEDSDDSVTGVTETYLVIDKKARKKSPSHEVKRRESMECGQPPSTLEAVPRRSSVLSEDNSPPVKKEVPLVKEEGADLPEISPKIEPDILPEQGVAENGDFLGFAGEEDGPLEEEENEDTEIPETAENLDEFFDETLANAQEFAVIDYVNESDGENEGQRGAGDEDSNTGDVDEDFDSDSMDEEEIEAMLDADFEKRKAEERPEDKFLVREKLILMKKGVDPFDILPEGWVQVSHNCGMPLYLHSKTRVCTLSKPYFLGPGSAKKHNIPMSAIPCLQYRKAMLEECADTRAGDNLSTDEKGNSQTDLDKTLQDTTEAPKAASQEETKENKDTTEKSADTETKQEEEVSAEKSQPVKLTCPMSTDQQSDKDATTESKSDEKEAASSEDKEGSKSGQKTEPTTENKPEEQKPQTMTPASEEGSTGTASVPSGQVVSGQSEELVKTDQSEKPEQTTKTDDEDLELIALKMIESSMQQDAEKVEAIVRTSFEASDEAMDTDSASQDPQKPSAEKPATDTDKPKPPNAEEMPVCKVNIMSVEDYKEQKCLKWDQVNEYCAKLFCFKKVYVKRFKTWKARRAHEKDRHKPSLPEGTRLLRCSVALPQSKVGGNDPAPRKKEFMLNPKGKSDVCILHEYAQHAMRVQPKYIFEDSDNALTPFTATIVIHGIRYGTGTAASKKAAKAEAATETLKILIPEFLKVREKSDPSQMSGDMSFFNEIKVEDPRVPDLTAKAGQPLPYEILNTCLKRNYGLGDTSITCAMEIIKTKRSEFTMKVAQHEAKVSCKNKREGKQRAAQVILQKMHPHINCWGSLLRLYARNAHILKEKKETYSIQQNKGYQRLNQERLPYIEEKSPRPKEAKVDTLNAGTDNNTARSNPQLPNVKVKSKSTHVIGLDDTCKLKHMNNSCHKDTRDLNIECPNKKESSLIKGENGENEVRLSTESSKVQNNFTDKMNRIQTIGLKHVENLCQNGTNHLNTETQKNVESPFIMETNVEIDAGLSVESILVQRKSTDEMIHVQTSELEQVGNLCQNNTELNTKPPKNEESSLKREKNMEIDAELNTESDDFWNIDVPEVLAKCFGVSLDHEEELNTNNVEEKVGDRKETMTKNPEIVGSHLTQSDGDQKAQEIINRSSPSNKIPDSSDCNKKPTALEPVPCHLKAKLECLDQEKANKEEDILKIQEDNRTMNSKHSVASKYGSKTGGKGDDLYPEKTKTEEMSNNSTENLRQPKVFYYKPAEIQGKSDFETSPVFNASGIVEKQDYGPLKKSTVGSMTERKSVPIRNRNHDIIELVKEKEENKATFNFVQCKKQGFKNVSLETKPSSFKHNPPQNTKNEKQSIEHNSTKNLKQPAVSQYKTAIQRKSDSKISSVLKVSGIVEKQNECQLKKPTVGSMTERKSEPKRNRSHDIIKPVKEKEENKTLYNSVQCKKQGFKNVDPETKTSSLKHNPPGIEDDKNTFNSVQCKKAEFRKSKTKTSSFENKPPVMEQSMSKKNLSETDICSKETKQYTNDSVQRKEFKTCQSNADLKDCDQQDSNLDKSKSPGIQIQSSIASTSMPQSKGPKDCVQSDCKLRKTEPNANKTTKVKTDKNRKPDSNDLKKEPTALGPVPCHSKAKLECLNPEKANKEEHILGIQEDNWTKNSLHPVISKYGSKTGRKGDDLYPEKTKKEQSVGNNSTENFKQPKVSPYKPAEIQRKSDSKTSPVFNVPGIVENQTECQLKKPTVSSMTKRKSEPIRNTSCEVKGPKDYVQPDSKQRRTEIPTTNKSTEVKTVINRKSSVGSRFKPVRDCTKECFQSEIQQKKTSDKTTNIGAEHKNRLKIQFSISSSSKTKTSVSGKSERNQTSEQCKPSRLSHDNQSNPVKTRYATDGMHDSEALKHVKISQPQESVKHSTFSTKTARSSLANAEEVKTPISSNIARSPVRKRPKLAYTSLIRPKLKYHKSSVFDGTDDSESIYKKSNTIETSGHPDLKWTGLEAGGFYWDRPPERKRTFPYADDVNYDCIGRKSGTKSYVKDCNNNEYSDKKPCYTERQDDYKNNRKSSGFSNKNPCYTKEKQGNSRGDKKRTSIDASYRQHPRYKQHNVKSTDRNQITIKPVHPYQGSDEQNSDPIQDKQIAEPKKKADAPHVYSSYSTSQQRQEVPLDPPNMSSKENDKGHTDRGITEGSFATGPQEPSNCINSSDKTYLENIDRNTTPLACDDNNKDEQHTENSPDGNFTGLPEQSQQVPYGFDNRNHGVPNVSRLQNPTAPVQGLPDLIYPPGAGFLLSRRQLVYPAGLMQPLYTGGLVYLPTGATQSITSHTLHTYMYEATTQVSQQFRFQN